MGAGGWVLMALAMLVLIALVVVLVFWLVNQKRGSDGALTPPGVSPREALDHRLVKGEITGEQYDELRARLAGSSSAGRDAPPSQGT